MYFELCKPFSQLPFAALASTKVCSSVASRKKQKESESLEIQIHFFKNVMIHHTWKWLGTH
jgi:hypothetical protein